MLRVEKAGHLKGDKEIDNAEQSQTKIQPLLKISSANAYAQQTKPELKHKYDTSIANIFFALSHALRGSSGDACTVAGKKEFLKLA